MNCGVKECPFIRSGECDVPPCETCFLPCKAREDRDRLKAMSLLRREGRHDKRTIHAQSISRGM